MRGQGVIPKVIWTSQDGLVTAEDLSGKRPVLLRFHTDINHIPGNVASSCVIADVGSLEAEVKAWGGRKSPTTTDKNTIQDFCLSNGFMTAHWWRYKNGEQPKKVWVYREP